MVASAQAYKLWRAIPKIAQTAYGTKNPDGDFVYLFPVKDPTPAKYAPAYQDDRAEVGKGHPWPTRLDCDRWDSSLAWKGDVTSWMMGWLAAFGLGTSTPEQLGATAAYKHTSLFSDPGDVGDQNPVVSVIEFDPMENQVLVRDLALNTLKLTGELGKRLQYDAAFIGSGYAEASVLAKPELTTPAGSFLLMTGGQLRLGVAGALVDESARFRSFEIGFDNKLEAEDGYAPGCGLYKNRCRFDSEGRAVTLKLVVLADSALEQAALEGNTLLQAVLTFEGATIEDAYKHALVVTFENLKYKLAEPSKEAGRYIYTLECEPLVVTGEGGDSDVVQVEVTNTETYYLEAPT